MKENYNVKKYRKKFNKKAYNRLLFVFFIVWFILLLCNIYLRKSYANYNSSKNLNMNTLLIENENLITFLGISNKSEINKLYKVYRKYVTKSNKKIKKLSKDYEKLTNQFDKVYKEFVIRRRKNNYELYKKSGYKKFIINSFDTMNQNDMGYPTGCEIVSLKMLLKYWNVDIEMQDLINSIPKGEIPYYEDGSFYGGNPNIEFVGDPNDINGYGVFDKPIENLANKYKLGINNATGTNLDDILDIVSESRPVLVWVSIDMLEPYVSATWKDKETDELIKWSANEHAVVIVGFDENNVMVADPLQGSVVSYSKQLFADRYTYFGMKALYY